MIEHIEDCPICHNKSKHIRNVEGYDYFSCRQCMSIFIERNVLDKIDQGESIVKYSDVYWKNELTGSKERAFGIALARMSEVFYYARLPIKRFLDIGTGAGYFLDSVSKYLPTNKHIF